MGQRARIVECWDGPLDGLVLTTSLPLLGHLWVDGNRKMCFRAAGKNRHPYLVSQVLRKVENEMRMRLEYAERKTWLCSGCEAIHKPTKATTCSLCGAPLVRISQAA